MTTTRTFSVPGMSCEHCRTAIESEVAPIDGVTSVVVDLGEKTVTVVGGDEEAIVGAIDEAGYDVV